MSRITNLDMDILRSFAAVVDLGGLSQAGRQLGRSQSAVSLQMKRLETQVGERLFLRSGRSLDLSETGEQLLAYARRILALNDEALADLRGVPVEGRLRFGTQQDFTESWLPTALARFAERHPAVRLQVSVGKGTSYLKALERGRFDLVLALGLGNRPTAEPLGHLPLVWIGRKDFVWRDGEPLPLVTFEGWCRFRRHALALLDEAGIPWRIVLTSPSLAGLWAAANAGLGITVRTAEGLPPDLTLLDEALGLPPLGTVDVSLHSHVGPQSPAAAAFAALVREHLPVHLRSLPGFQVA